MRMFTALEVRYRVIPPKGQSRFVIDFRDWVILKGFRSHARACDQQHAESYYDPRSCLHKVFLIRIEPLDA